MLKNPRFSTRFLKIFDHLLLLGVTAVWVGEIPRVVLNGHTSRATTRLISIVYPYLCSIETIRHLRIYVKPKNVWMFSPHPTCYLQSQNHPQPLLIHLQSVINPYPSLNLAWPAPVHQKSKLRIHTQPQPRIFFGYGLLQDQKRWNSMKLSN